ncbi:16S rRNA (guanine(966)-N(2))-methyltransferase RsmD [Erysipelothrix urinaevulpis]|uniref:16S rRNA (guanine(966)-N(2))-methyltransferase RsmD n=1 Tax=Erysipelothrix urinaevulpis TaxID=2683717 RepID=UPI00135BC3CF|nr:16S rRNA (guanine(966)-N(2))-methyltransferase RsmD [Erysipelothrix urinaevulpis]
MRIIAGEFGSRKINSLKSRVSRPTSDKVRAAIFDHLGSYFDEGTFLDLFSGTGAMALEALSRGYEKAVMVEVDRKAAAMIQENIHNFDVKNRSDVKVMDVPTYLKRSLEVFDCIFLDPPYDYKDIDKVVATIASLEILKEKGYCIVETDRNVHLRDGYGNLSRYRSKTYGNTTIHYYQRT